MLNIVQAVLTWAGADPGFVERGGAHRERLARGVRVKLN